jgi:predicted negative regulator of RcsB-dependent stress response
LLITTVTTDTGNKIKQLSLLYQQYFTVDTVPENYPIYLAEAFTAYQDNDYTAIQKLNLSNIPETRGTDSRQHILQLGNYYKGIAFLKTNTLPQALSNLQWVEQNADDAKLKIKAQWYLALGYIKNGDAAEARKLLTIISNNSTYYGYKNRATTLLKALQE